MLFESNSYLNNKHKLTEDQQNKMEENFEIYFNCIIKGVKDWETMETSWEHATSMTRKQLANYIGIDNIIEIRSSYPIGFNYDIDGNKM